MSNSNEFKTGDKVARINSSVGSVIKGQVYTVIGFGAYRELLLSGVEGLYKPDNFILVTDETTVEDTLENKYVVTDSQYFETRIFTLEQIENEVREGCLNLSDTTIYKLGEEVKINLKIEVVSNGEEG